MIDRDKLKEALAAYDEAMRRIPDLAPQESITVDSALIVEAARLAVEGLAVWCCVIHDLPGNETRGCREMPGCEMVSMILIDGTTPEGQSK